LQVTSKNLGIDERIFAYIAGSVAETPFYQLLGIILRALGPGYAELTVISKSDHVNPQGMVHGGLLLSLADAAMGNAVRSLGIRGVTVDISTAIMSPAPLGEEITAQGRVIKAGKNMIFAEARVYAGDQPLADAQGTFFRIDDLVIKE